jgi:hypothetical protein
MSESRSRCTVCAIDHGTVETDHRYRV